MITKTTIFVTIRLPRPPWRARAWLKICPLCERKQCPSSLRWRIPPPWTFRIPWIIKMFYDSPRHNPFGRTTRKTSGISFCLQQYFESLLKYTFIQVQSLYHPISCFIQVFFYPENYSSVVRDKSDAKCSPQCPAWTLTLHNLPP